MMNYAVLLTNPMNTITIKSHHFSNLLYAIFVSICYLFTWFEAVTQLQYNEVAIHLQHYIKINKAGIYRQFTELWQWKSCQ